MLLVDLLEGTLKDICKIILFYFELMNTFERDILEAPALFSLINNKIVHLTLWHDWIIRLSRWELGIEFHSRQKMWIRPSEEREHFLATGKKMHTD